MSFVQMIYMLTTSPQTLLNYDFSMIPILANLGIVDYQKCIQLTNACIYPFFGISELLNTLSQRQLL